MSIRDHTAAYWLATMLVCLVVLSTQAWASHVHWSGDDQQPVAGQTAGQVVDNANSQDTVDQSEAGYSDHCGAHLVGLHQEPCAGLRGGVAISGVTSRSGYQSVDHEPPVEPPIV